MYALDLSTLVWEKVWPPPTSADGANTSRQQTNDTVEELDEGLPETRSRGPKPRYFHSANAHQGKIYIFGGMGYQPSASRPQSPANSISSRASKNSKTSKSSRQSADKKSVTDDEPQFCVLSDLIIFDTIKRTWSFPSPPVVAASETPTGSPNIPRGPSARYAHLSVITNKCLVIIGGQDVSNKYLEEVSVLDTERMVWIETRRFEGHCGTYRSVATSRSMSIHSGQEGNSRRSQIQTAANETEELATRHAPRASTSSSVAGQPTLNGLVQQGYSLPPSPDSPEPIWIYSNYTFSNVKRSLDMISAPRSPNFAAPVTHLSHLMASGPTLPPGLRFPSGAVINNSLIIAGTFLGRPSSSFAIYSLDISQAAKGGKMNWTKIDPGTVLGNSASWNRAVFWRNSVVILGDRDRDIAADYDHRQTNFNHVAFIDLESYGIYNPPLRLLTPSMQELGLNMLANPSSSDFEILCSDGKRLACSRKLLEERWPWFNIKMAAFREKTRTVLGELSDENHANRSASTVVADLKLSDLCVTPRTLELAESSSVAFAALQYFYTLSLCTPLQHQVNVLVGLLLFARDYDVPHLRALAVYGLHGALSQTSQNAPACYEVSTLAGAYALQVRSLKRMMSRKLPLTT